MLLCVSLGVPGKPQISGFENPVRDGETITLTCTSTGSKPPAKLRWFKGREEVEGERCSTHTKSGFLWIVCHFVRTEVRKLHVGQSSYCTVWTRVQEGFSIRNAKMFFHGIVLVAMAAICECEIM